MTEREEPIKSCWFAVAGRCRIHRLLRKGNYAERVDAGHILTIRIAGTDVPASL